MEKKYFSLTEANTLLPKLRPLFEKFLGLQEKHAEDQDAYNEIYFKIANNGQDFDSEELKKKKEEISQDEKEIEELAEKIESYGCEIKGMDPPLLDFPTKLNGTEGYLCWRFDEEEIRYWHDTTSGFAGRQPL